MKTTKNQEPLNPQDFPTTNLTTKLISIDPKRIDEFKKRNPHIRIDDERLGTKEEHLSAEEIEVICSSELAKVAKASKGSIGNAHSIFQALKECAEQQSNYLILEDDVTLHPNTLNFLSKNWGKVSTADFIALGVNTDAPITFEPIREMKFSGAFMHASDKHPSYRRIGEIFHTYSHAEVSIFRLHNMFGTCAFMVSPLGARKLLSKAFPLNSNPIQVPLLPHPLLGISFDRRLNAILGSIDARICIPFLAITPNDTKSQR
jgi:GR25 family glycosyltransferase involved in LPS biosynthesis